MIRDITFGQFLPGNSFLHRLDPRTKLILTLLYMVGVFTINTITAFLFLGVLLLLLIKASSIPVKFILKSIKPLYIFVVFTAVLNIFMSDGVYLVEYGWFHISLDGVIITFTMALRLILLVGGSSLLTYTTTPIALTDGLESLLKPFEKIKFPSHELAMMMTIALRFIPTIIEETDKIIKAQTARGADFDTGGLLKKAKAMVPILIPLFISSFRRADELALAMECRGYQGGKNRTKLKQLQYSRADFVAIFVFFLMFFLCIALNYGIKYLPQLL